MNTPTRRDRMLYQMGIEQWKLVHPQCLKGVVNLPIPETIKLIVISRTTLNKNDQILKDILLSLDLGEENCLFLTQDLAVNLNLHHSIAFLCLDLDEDFNSQLKQHFPQANLLQSQELGSLLGESKRQLWKQMQKIM